MPESAIASENESHLQLVWDADVMRHHTEGGLFNPYDIELPDIETTQVHGEVQIVPGKPTEWTLESNGKVSSNIFALFSGFGGVKFSSGPFSNAMARLDMPTLTVEPVRADDRSNRERLTNPHAIHVETMEAVFEDLAERSDIVLSNQPDGTKAIPIGHSMGGEPALKYAEANSDITEAVILIATIGFGSPNILEIMKRIPKGIRPSITEEMIPFLKSNEVEFSLDALKTALGYFTKNPLRTIGEVASCLTSKQSERAHDLRRLNIPTAYAQPTYDLLVQGAKGAKSAVDIVGEIERAGHMVLQAKPSRAAHWVRSSLDTLEIAKQAA